MSDESVTQVQFSNLKKWYREKMLSKFQPYQDGIDMLLKRIAKRLDDLQTVLESFQNAVEIDSNKVSKAAAERMVSKLDHMVSSEMQVPTKPESFTQVKQFIDQLIWFQNSVQLAGRRWVRRLTKEYKPIIRSLDAHLKNLAKETTIIMKYQERFKWLERSENLQDRFSELNSEIKKQNGVNRKLNKKSEERNKLVNLINITKAKLEGFRGKTTVTQYRDAKKGVNEIRKQIELQIHLVAKSFNKYQRKSSGPMLTPIYTSILNEMLHDPYNYLISDSFDINKLEDALTSYNQILKSGAVDLKPSRLRRTIRRIDSILKSSELTELRDKAIQFSKTRDNLADQIEFGEEERIKKKILEMEKDQNLIEEKITKFEEDFERINQRILHIKSNIEKEIRSLTKEKVEIVGVTG